MSEQIEQLRGLSASNSDWQTRAEKAEAALESAKTAIDKIKFPKHRGACHFWGQCICGAAAQDAAINAARSAIGLEVRQ